MCKPVANHVIIDQAARGGGGFTISCIITFNRLGMEGRRSAREGGEIRCVVSCISTGGGW